MWVASRVFRASLLTAASLPPGSAKGPVLPGHPWLHFTPTQAGPGQWSEEPVGLRKMNVLPFPSTFMLAFAWLPALLGVQRYTGFRALSLSTHNLPALLRFPLKHAESFLQDTLVYIESPAGVGKTRR